MKSPEGIGNQQSKTTFSEQPSSPETDMYRCYKELVGGAYTDPETERTEQPEGYELKQHAVAYLQWVLRRVKSTDTLHQWWREAGKDVAELLARFDRLPEGVERFFDFDGDGTVNIPDVTALLRGV